MLRLTASAAMMDDKHPRGALRRLLAQVAFNETEREVDASGHPSRRPHGAVGNEDPIHFDDYLGEAPAKLFGMRPVGGRASPVQNPPPPANGKIRIVSTKQRSPIIPSA
jgi:hypothetical protein